MPTLTLPYQLKQIVGSEDFISTCQTVGEMLHQLVTEYPDLQPYIFNASNTQLVPFINLYLNKQNIRQLTGLATPLSESDQLSLIIASAGG